MYIDFNKENNTEGTKFNGISKSEAINVMENLDLTEKSG